jgi:hypothetical protein
MYIVASLGTYNVEKLKKFLELKFCEPGGCVFSNRLKMARARNLKALIIYFELIDGTFVRFLITVQNFRKFALAIHFSLKK